MEESDQASKSVRTFTAQNPIFTHPMRLTSRFLNNNQINGSLPQWKELAALRTVNLDLNNLCGSLPVPSPNFAQISLGNQVFDCMNVQANYSGALCNPAGGTCFTPTQTPTLSASPSQSASASSSPSSSLTSTASASYSDHERDHNHFTDCHCEC